MGLAPLLSKLRWLALAAALALALGGLPGCMSRKVSAPPSPTPPAKKETPGKLPATQRPYTISGQTYHPLPSAEGFSETGVASWYGPNFHGKRTSNGEVYDMEAMTAAHKLLPMDTWVEVRNLENGKRAVVRVNDRGPFVDGRVIDLSKAAARELGVLGRGTAQVEVVALGYKQAGTGVAGRPAVYQPPASYQEGVFTVQVGAFSDPANAQRLAERLKPVWGQVYVVRYDRGDAVFHRVRVGQVKDISQAKELEARLRAAGLADSFAVAW
ncbi:MAG: septal ring lytic transglycosylase RlpA family protein [Thermodesulfobacteriota bacterium]